MRFLTPLRHGIGGPFLVLAGLGLLLGIAAGMVSAPTQVTAAVRDALSGGTAASGQAAPSAGYQRQDVLVLHLYFKDIVDRDRLAREWDAVEASTTKGYLTIYGDQAIYKAMLAQGLHAEIDQATTQLVNNPHLFGQNGPDTFYGGYKTVEEMQTFLDQMVAAHPTLAVKVDIGNSWCKDNPGCTLPAPYNGYDVWALHITNQAIPGPKPVFWYEAAIHAREIATPEIAMLYIQWLLDGYNSDPDAHWLVDWHDIWVVPMLNPDGHHIVESGGGGSSPYYQRKNSNNTNGCTSWPPDAFTQFGTDNNRNFPFKWNCCGGSSGAPCDQTYHGTGPASDPETQAAINQVRLLIPDQRGPNDTDPAPLTTTGIFQDMHSNGQLDLYPWGWTGSPTANGPELANIGQHMSAADASPSGNSYQACQPPNCLYVVDGGAVDWAYGELGAATLSIEVAGEDFFVPLAETTGVLWPQNKGALIYEAKLARTPYLLAHGPDAANVATTPMTVTQGSPSALAGTINFAWSGDAFSQNIGAAEYYVDTPPWAGGTAMPMTGSFTSPTVAVAATIDTTGLAIGRHIIFVRGRGVNNFQTYQTWGPITAAFLDVVPVGSITPTPVPPSATVTPLPTTSTATVIPVSPTATAVACAAQFTDVTGSDPFYTYITWMACRGYINGYTCGGPGEPCDPGHNPYFRPANNVTRGQLLKMVVLAAGWPLVTPVSPTFADVPVAQPFYPYIETGASHGIISGYTCGGANEPCDPQHRPYFRASNDITRGQLSKVIALAKGYVLTGHTQSFTDVPPANPFFAYIEAVYANAVVSGYNCGNPEPCPGLYFRPASDATRGQVTKFVTLAYGGP